MAFGVEIMKKSFARRIVVASLACMLIFAALVILVHIVRGNTFKMQTVESILDVKLPDTDHIEDYTYIPGGLSATLFFQKGQYEEIREALRAKQMECYFCEINYEAILPLKIPGTDSKQLERIEYLVGSESSDNFCGVLSQTEDETILYVVQPSYAIAEKWKQGDGSFVLANPENGDEIPPNSEMSK